MRRVLLVLLAAVVGLSLALPTLAARPEDDTIRLRVFEHYPKGKPAPKPPTCNVTDRTSYLYGLTGWKLGTGASYYVNWSTIPGNISANAAQTAIAASFATWEAESGVQLRYAGPTSATGSKYDGQNVVVWARTRKGAIAITYTWYYASTGQVAEVDTVMNSSHPWLVDQPSVPGASVDDSCGNYDYYDVQNILTHEIGHWMGLDDLYSDPEEDLTMYGYGAKGELKKRTLGPGDELGIEALY
ncbi:MAG: hypothetical protein QME94_18705 [Anaerolineae bacterium]|nr:hypothetical protein [Anaerolineae bacterium]